MPALLCVSCKFISPQRVHKSATTLSLLDNLVRTAPCCLSVSSSAALCCHLSVDCWYIAEQQQQQHPQSISSHPVPHHYRRGLHQLFHPRSILQPYNGLHRGHGCCGNSGKQRNCVTAVTSVLQPSLLLLLLLLLGSWSFQED